MSLGCVLCSIPFRHHLPDASWAKEFRAVYTKYGEWDEARLSGVGLARNEQFRAPVDPTKRYDDEGIELGSTIPIRLCTMSFNSILDPDPSAGTSPYWGFGFHSSCWTILTQFGYPDLTFILLVCLSMPFSPDRLLNWGHRYGGVVSEVARGLSIINSLFWTDQPGSPIRSNPLDIQAIAPLSQPETMWEAFASFAPNRNYLLKKGSAVDCFIFLPTEILLEILIISSSKDVCRLRRASRTFASVALSESFWASRFSQGHEYHCIFEPRQSRPISWKALYGSVPLIQNNPNLIQRKRIWSLAAELQLILAQMNGTCHGNPVRSPFDPNANENSLEWLDASYRNIEHETLFFIGTRTLRVRTIDIPDQLQRLYVSFVRVYDNQFISGLRFQQKNGESVRIGYSHDDEEVHMTIPSDTHVNGCHLAFHDRGIKGIALSMEDGTLSPWIGEIEGIPKRRLVTVSGRVAKLKAGFDAMKLVTLSVPAPSITSQDDLSLRDIGLWEQDIPPKRYILDESNVHHIKGHLYKPISTVVFGGPDGQDLWRIIEIIVWGQKRDIVGIQFIYTDPPERRSVGSVGTLVQRESSQEADENNLVPIRFPIDGPGGEILSRMQFRGSRRAPSIKIRTNFGREKEFHPPTRFWPDTSPRSWTTIQPSDQTIVGLYCVLTSAIYGIGLMSIKH